jgi:hypothetical protein
VETSFLFWNLQKKDLRDRIVRLIKEYKIDILAVAENNIDEDEFINYVKDQIDVDLEVPIPILSQKKKVNLFIKKGISKSVEQNPGDRMIIYRIDIDGCLPFLLSVAHLRDPMNNDVDDRNEFAIEESLRIRIAEGDTGIDMNPFDRGVFGFRGFNAVMTKKIASKQQRTTTGITVPYFYNPMWGCFGDVSQGPSGTYYYSNDTSPTFWNIFDQVLLRPSLMDSLKELSILDSDGVDSLLTPSGIPNTRISSDHLPLKFVVDI